MRQAALVLILVLGLAGGRASAETTETVVLRGRPQQLHIYGTRGVGAPVIVSSGDGGWIHLAPHVADVLAAHGYFVIGFNAKEYLKAFTSETATLHPGDVPADYRALMQYAARGSAKKPVLIGVSEGAGLSVLAAADPAAKALLAGVLVLGLPNLNELGWRWKDSLIYVTHGVPSEPTFSAAAYLGKVTPIPLAAIYSSRDEFVPVPEIQGLMAQASEPKRLWMVASSDHRFSSNVGEFDRRLLEALDWASRSQPQ